MVDNKGVWVLLQAVEHLRAEGFTDFVVELNGDNMRFASEKRRNELEAFLEREREKPDRRAERGVQRLVSHGAAGGTDVAGGLVHCAIGVVGDIRAGDLRGMDVPPAGDRLQCRCAGERIRHEVDGLLFQVGDARALARTMRRACTEEGLWDRLVAGIEAPPERDVMVDRFLRCISK